MPEPSQHEALLRSCLTSCVSDLERAMGLMEAGMGTLTDSFAAFEQRVREQRSVFAELSAMVQGSNEVEGFAPRMQRLVLAFLADVTTAERATTDLVQRLYAVGPELTSMHAGVTKLSSMARRQRFIALNAQVGSQKLGPKGLAFGIVAEELKGLAADGATLSAEVHAAVSRANERRQEVERHVLALTGVDSSGSLEVQDSLVRIVDRLNHANRSVSEALAAVDVEAARVHTHLGFQLHVVTLLSSAIERLRQLDLVLECFCAAQPDLPSGIDSLFSELEPILRKASVVQQTSLDEGTVELF